MAWDTAHSSGDLLGNPAGFAGTSAPVQRSYHEPSRAVVFACGGVLAALNGQAGYLFQRLHTSGLPAAAFELGGISVVIWFAMYATLKIGFEGAGEALRPWDLWILAAVILLTIAPVSIAASGALLFSAVYLLLTTRPRQLERRVALVLCALTGPLIWGPALIAIVPQALLDLDAQIVAFLIGTPVHGNVVGALGGGDEVVIGGPCSSVHNISLAVLLWTTAAALFKVRINAQYMVVGVAMVALMFSLNIARVAAIGTFPQDYEFLHFGLGGALFAWAGLLGAGLLASLGVLRAQSDSQ